jgi:hypothetical protein
MVLTAVVLKSAILRHDADHGAGAIVPPWTILGAWSALVPHTEWVSLDYT